jgi:hypothetical protein
MTRLHRAFLNTAACLLAASATLAAEDGGKWNVASKASDLTVYERLRKGSALREFKAVGLIAMPPEAVRRVLDDVEAYPHFVPYVVEARVISRDAAARVSYQRISLPLVGDRDYTIRVHTETRRTPAGGSSFCNRWQAANELGPAEKAGVTRVKITEGSWLLEPSADGRQTHATYFIYSDSAGSLPSFLVNAASKTAIPKLFEAIRKQAQLGKYSAPQ